MLFSRRVKDRDIHDTSYMEQLGSTLVLLRDRGPLDTATLCVNIHRDDEGWMTPGSGDRLFMRTRAYMGFLRRSGYVSSDKGGGWWRITEKGKARCQLLDDHLIHGDVHFRAYGGRRT